MIKGQSIICISTSDWDRPWGSKQQLMSRLSASNRVLYIEYQASFLHLCSLPFLFSRIKRSRNRLRKVNKNLYVFTPYLYLPFGYYFRSINKINQNIMLWSLRKTLKKLDFVNPIVWVYSPCAIDLLGRLNEKLTLYHCIADFSNEKQNLLRNKTISSMEKELLIKSDIVLVLTEHLFRKYAGMNINTHLFPSAVDDDLFSPLLNNNIKEPADISGLKRPRVGMIGYLDNRLDVDLLCYIADEHPEWSIVLIGPRIEYLYKFRLLSRRKNICFLPEKKNNEMPVYIKSLDVCMIPYIINEFTNNISPLKLYEYLAFGKPIVSTRLADLERFGDVVRLSDSKEDFVKNISLSLLENDKQLVNKRLDLARENSWDRRIQDASLFIKNGLSGVDQKC